MYSKSVCINTQGKEFLYTIFHYVILKLNCYVNNVEIIYIIFKRKKINNVNIENYFKKIFFFFLFSHKSATYYIFMNCN